MKGLILEGIPGSGKTSVLRELKKKTADMDASWLLLNEQITERPLEPLKSADLRKSIAHLNRLTNLLSGMQEITNGNEKHKAAEFRFILERFHFSHCLDIAGVEKFESYVEVDRRLNELRSKIVVLRLDDAHILDRCVNSTKQHRPLAWAKYLDRIADTDQGIADHYRKQQEQFIGLCRKTSIPSMVVDASSGDWEDLSFQILEFIERS